MESNKHPASYTKKVIAPAAKSIFDSLVKEMELDDVFKTIKQLERLLARAQRASIMKQWIAEEKCDIYYAAQHFQVESQILQKVINEEPIDTRYFKPVLKAMRKCREELAARN